MTRRIPVPHNSLVSFHYMQKFDISRLDGLRLIADSGAYSAKTQGAEIKLADLCAWAREWGDRFCWVAALDVIGDPVGSRKNWDHMREMGINAVPTLHFPEPPSAMDGYAAEGVTFMGLGGQVGGNQKALLRWVVSVMRYARDNHPGMRFHGWGATGKMSLLLPYYSVDSTSWSQSYRFGSMRLRDPRDGKEHAIKFDGRDVYRPEVATLLSSFYGISPERVARSSGQNADLIVELSALSASVLEQDMRRKHGTITAPESLREGEPDGPHLPLAHGGTNKVSALAAFARRAADEDGPHLHMANTSGPRLTQLAEFVRRDSGEEGPHLHLASGSSPVLTRLASLARESGD